MAPYSREYQKYASRVRAQVSAADRSAESLGKLNEQTRQQAAGLKVEYERIAEQVRQTVITHLKASFSDQLPV